MPTLTEIQADALAQAFRDSSKASSDYLHEQWANLSDEEREVLHQNIYDLLLRADDMEALSGILALDDLQSSLDQIGAAVGSAQDFIRKVANIKKSIGVVTAILSLATAVVAKNPKDIVASLNALKTAIG